MATVVSRNVYWLSTAPETLRWRASTWFFTPTKTYADFTALSGLPTVRPSVTACASTGGAEGTTQVTVTNDSDAVAFFLRCRLTAGTKRSRCHARPLVRRVHHADARGTADRDGDLSDRGPAWRRALAGAERLERSSVGSGARALRLASCSQRGPGPLELPPGVVRASHERPRLDVRDPHRLADALVLGELLRGDPTVDGQVAASSAAGTGPSSRGRTRRRGGPRSASVTSDGVSPIPRIRFDFVIWPGRRRSVRREHVERSVVAERRPDPVVQSSHRLEVVGEDVGFGIDHGRDVAFPALEVGRKHLDAAVRHGFAHRPDRRRPRSAHRRRAGRRARRP